MRKREQEREAERRQEEREARQRYTDHVERLRAGELPDFPELYYGDDAYTWSEAVVEHINALTDFVRKRRGTW